MLRGNLLVGQSGGSTAVINCSLAGVISEAQKHPRVVRAIYGMRFGIEGFMERKVIDLTKTSTAQIADLRKAPGSALGSTRHKLQPADFEPVLKLFRKLNIRFLHLIGGNDTMDTINRLVKYAGRQGYEMRGVGVPKTVDNDLYGTDHTPGFPSCARAVAIDARHGAIIARDMERVDPVLVMQTIGRDAGWLAAASALARKKPGDAPHLIYVPERAFNWNQFRKDVKAVHKKHGWVSVVVGEGVADRTGRPISYGEKKGKTVKDKFGNIEFGSTGGVGAARELFISATKTLGIRGEFQQPESLPLCAADRRSAVDVKEAFQVGRRAVAHAVRGGNDVMITIERKPGAKYVSSYGTVPLHNVAVCNKKMPAHYINKAGNDVTAAFIRYAKPLIGAIPGYRALKMKMKRMR
jgi:6-phosphofructokinase 1